MKYAATVVAAGALLFPSFAIANGHISDDPHPGADKQQPATHGDCKNPGSKSDTHNTTGNHNGYDCSGQPSKPPACKGDDCGPPACGQSCQPQPQPQPQPCGSCQPQPCPCACPTPTPTPTPNHRKHRRHHGRHRSHHRRHHPRHHHHHKRRIPIFTG